MQQAELKQLRQEDAVYKNRHMILAVILIGIFMAGLDSSMVNVALPAITTQFGGDIVRSQWTVTGYLLAMTGLFIFFGKLSEYTGKVKIFLAGWALFGLSSLACGLAPGLDGLIGFRILQGIGASMVSAVGMALVYMVFPPQERGKAMGIFGLAFATAALIGPTLGGFIVDHLGWAYMFFVNVPLCALLLLLAFRYMKIPEPTSGRLEIDWIGAVTLFAAVVSFMLLCTEIAKGLEVTGTIVACAVVFALSAVSFLCYESRCAKPLLDLSIFRNSKFTLPIVSAMLLYMSIGMANTLGPFFFQGAMGYTASDVGLILTVVPLCMMFVAPLSGAFYDKRHSRFQAAAGLVACGAGMLVSGIGILAMSFWVILGGFVLRGIGVGVFNSPNSIETLSTVAREKLATASSVQSTANYAGMMVGVALSTIMATVSLNGNGYYGPVILSGSSLLSSSIGSIMIIGAALCVIAMIASVLRNIGQVPGQPGK